MTAPPSDNAAAEQRATSARARSQDARRLAESLSESLLASEERYRTLINSIDVGFCIIEVLFDPNENPCDYCFLEANPAFERHTGLSGVLGKTIREMVPDLNDFWFQTYGTVARTGEATRFEDHASAMNRWFEVYAQRVGQAGENKVGIFFTDITARKEAEEGLRQSEERERARLVDIFMRAPAFMASLRGPQHTFEMVNAPYLQLIGRHDSESVIGKTIAEVLPEIAEQGFIELLDTVYRTGEALVGKDSAVYFRGQEEGPVDERYVDFSFQPLFDEDEAVSGILVHGIDLTERKHLEQERELLLEQQRQLVANLRNAGLRQRKFLKEMLAGFTEGRLKLCDTLGELPTALPSLSDDVILTAPHLRLLRREIEDVAELLRLPAERLADFTTAVHEAGMNAVKYGGGGTARVCGDKEKGTIQVWVRDHGPGIDEELIHRAVEQGWTTGGFGQGFFLMRSCADCLFLLTGKKGTTIVLEMERAAPKPSWLQGDS